MVSVKNKHQKQQPLLNIWLNKALENKIVDLSSSRAQSDKPVFKRYPLVQAKI